jgi:hypothetical protein
VRSISAVHDLAVFRRFLALVASRHGQVLNKSDLVAPLGMSVPGIGRWLDILEATGQIPLVLPPFHRRIEFLFATHSLHEGESKLWVAPFVVRGLSRTGSLRLCEFSGAYRLSVCPALDPAGLISYG